MGNRRSFVNKVVAGTGAVVIASTVSTPGGMAWAAEDVTSAYKKNRRSVDNIRVESYMDAEQDYSAASLLSKMGLKDVPGAADNALERRKQLAGQKQYSGRKTVYGSYPERQRKRMDASA